MASVSEKCYTVSMFSRNAERPNPDKYDLQQKLQELKKFTAATSRIDDGALRKLTPQELISMFRGRGIVDTSFMDWFAACQDFDSANPMSKAMSLVLAAKSQYEALLSATGKGRRVK